MRVERAKSLKTSRRNQGQVALEYALATVIVAALGSMLFIFGQSFVQGNLYGSAGEYNESVYFLAEENKAFGLEKVVSLPFP